MFGRLSKLNIYSYCELSNMVINNPIKFKNWAKYTYNM